MEQNALVRHIMGGCKGTMNEVSGWVENFHRFRRVCGYRAQFDCDSRVELVVAEIVEGSSEVLQVTVAVVRRLSVGVTDQV
jgi:hypothetical protein